MKNTYYPNENALVMERRGRMIGFRGRIAERMLAKLIHSGVPVHIGIVVRRQEMPGRQVNVNQN